MLLAVLLRSADDEVQVAVVVDVAEIHALLERAVLAARQTLAELGGREVAGPVVAREDELVADLVLEKDVEVAVAVHVPGDGAADEVGLEGEAALHRLVGEVSVAVVDEQLEIRRVAAEVADDDEVHEPVLVDIGVHNLEAAAAVGIPAREPRAGIDLEGDSFAVSGADEVQVAVIVHVGPLRRVVILVADEVDLGAGGQHDAVVGIPEEVILGVEGAVDVAVAVHVSEITVVVVAVAAARREIEAVRPQLVALVREALPGRRRRLGPRRMGGCLLRQVTNAIRKTSRWRYQNAQRHENPLQP